MDPLYELNVFENLHGVPLNVGMKVTVNKDVLYSNEWIGEYFVVGVNIYDGKIDVTLGEDITDSGYNGWSLSQLTPVI